MQTHSDILVLDNGLWSMKCGFAGDEAPRHLERTIIATSKNATISEKIHRKNFYNAKDIMAKSNYLDILSPVSIADPSHIERSIDSFLRNERSPREPSREQLQIREMDKLVPRKSELLQSNSLEVQKSGRVHQVEGRYWDSGSGKGDMFGTWIRNERGGWSDPHI